MALVDSHFQYVSGDEGIRRLTELSTTTPTTTHNTHNNTHAPWRNNTSEKTKTSKWSLRRPSPRGAKTSANSLNISPPFSVSPSELPLDYHRGRVGSERPRKLNSELQLDVNHNEQNGGVGDKNRKNQHERRRSSDGIGFRRSRISPERKNKDCYKTVDRGLDRISPDDIIIGSAVIIGKSRDDINNHGSSSPASHADEKEAELSRSSLGGAQLTHGTAKDNTGIMITASPPGDKRQDYVENTDVLRTAVRYRVSDEKASISLASVDVSRNIKRPGVNPPQQLRINPEKSEITALKSASIPRRRIGVEVSDYISMSHEISGSNRCEVTTSGHKTAETRGYNSSEDVDVDTIHPWTHSGRATDYVPNGVIPRSVISRARLDLDHTRTPVKVFSSTPTGTATRNMAASIAASVRSSFLSVTNKDISRIAKDGQGVSRSGAWEDEEIGRREDDDEVMTSEVHWTDETFTVPQLIEDLTDRLPVIARATKGFYSGLLSDTGVNGERVGEERWRFDDGQWEELQDLDLCPGQVVQICRCCSQWRVSGSFLSAYPTIYLPQPGGMSADEGRCHNDETPLNGSQPRSIKFSVPVDSHTLVRFHMTSDGWKSLADDTTIPHHPMLLAEFLNHVQLPCDVDMILNWGVPKEKRDGDENCQRRWQRGTLYSVERADFLLASKIKNGWLDRDDITVIPSQLKAEFQLAVDWTGTSRDEWLDFCGMYARAGRHLKFTRINGYNGIIFEEWGNMVKPDNSNCADVPSLSSPVTHSRLTTSLSADCVTSPSIHQSLASSHPTDESPTTFHSRARSLAPPYASSAESLRSGVSGGAGQPQVLPSRSTESLLPRKSRTRRGAAAKMRSLTPSAIDRPSSLLRGAVENLKARKRRSKEKKKKNAVVVIVNRQSNMEDNDDEEYCQLEIPPGDGKLVNTDFNSSTPLGSLRLESGNMKINKGGVVKMELLDCINASCTVDESRDWSTLGESSTTLTSLFDMDNSQIYSREGASFRKLQSSVDDRTSRTDEVRSGHNNGAYRDIQLDSGSTGIDDRRQKYESRPAQIPESPVMKNACGSDTHMLLADSAQHNVVDRTPAEDIFERNTACYNLRATEEIGAYNITTSDDEDYSQESLDRNIPFRPAAIVVQADVHQQAKPQKFMMAECVDKSLIDNSTVREGFDDANGMHGRPSEEAKHQYVQGRFSLDGQFDQEHQHTGRGENMLLTDRALYNECDRRLGVAMLRKLSTMSDLSAPENTQPTASHAKPQTPTIRSEDFRTTTASNRGVYRSFDNGIDRIDTTSNAQTTDREIANYRSSWMDSTSYAQGTNSSSSEELRARGLLRCPEHYLKLKNVAYPQSRSTAAGECKDAMTVNRPEAACSDISNDDKHCSDDVMTIHCGDDGTLISVTDIKTPNSLRTRSDNSMPVYKKLAFTPGNYSRSSDAIADIKSGCDVTSTRDGQLTRDDTTPDDCQWFGSGVGEYARSPRTSSSTIMSRHTSTATDDGYQTKDSNSTMSPEHANTMPRLTALQTSPFVDACAVYF